MPVPKRQHSKSRSAKRAAGKHKIAVVHTNCLTCKNPVSQHTVCAECGFYKGTKVLRTKSERAQERKLAREIKERSMQEVEVMKKLRAQEQAKKIADAELAESSSKNKN